MNKKILIGTPSYGNMVHIDYLSTVTRLQNATILNLGNESLITRARNKIFAMFLDYIHVFDYLLFLDADVSVQPGGIEKLVESGKHLIGAPVALKSLDKFKLNYGKVLDDTNKPILEVDRIGTAVMLISKKLALDIKKYVKEQHPEWIYYTNPEYSNLDKKIPVYDVFKVDIYDGEYLSEDYYFCKLARELGYKIYVDTSVYTEHNAMLSLPNVLSLKDL